VNRSVLINTWRRRLGATAICALGLAACTAGEVDGPGVTIVATTGIWADVVANLACDGLAPVEALVPSGTDPHAYEPSLADRARLEGASLIVVNGAGLEEGLADTIDAVDDEGTVILTMTDLITIVDGDPHIWFDPSQVAAALPGVADALVLTGLDEAAVGNCTRSYVDELTALDAKVAAEITAIPADQRKIVTNHDALGYFANRYGLEVVGTVVPTRSTLAASNPRQLAELTDLMIESSLSVIFVEATESSDDAQAVADRAGATIVELHTGALGPPDGGADTYVGLISTDARLIVDALS
jgi:zinc/manganese transport system substrate-binding protein